MNIVPFAFEGNQIRVVEIEGEPWFVGKDVALALGYSNPRDALGRHCRRAQDVGGSGIATPAGIDPQTTIIPEGDVYRLIVKSNLPKAEAFEEMVMDKILPTIRKTGAYGIPHAPATSEKLSREVRLQMREFGKFGKLMGLEGNQLALSVSSGVEKVTGVNPMTVMGVSHIPSRREGEDVNVSDLGARVGLSAQAMNLKLISAGFQNSYRNTKGKLCYELTEAGKKAGGRWFDAQKAQGGRPIMQILWPLSVADLFKEGGAA